MTRGSRIALGLLLVATAAAVAAGAAALRRGLSARDEPSAVEAWVARAARRLAMPRAVVEARNPVPPSPGMLVRARAHFADHCASCHGNDGKGRTKLGQSLYPKAPDMTLARTQGLSDGEIFSVIENGIRLTGMPAWGGPGANDNVESWELVHFVRHLPRITAAEVEEMESLNPRSRRELEEEERERRFLAGEDAGPAGAAKSASPHSH